MVFLDTNVLIYAFDPASPFFDWSRNQIADALSSGGAAINPVILAELSVGCGKPENL